MRTEQQERALNWTPQDLAEWRAFDSLPAIAIGLDGIDKLSCCVNGLDTAMEQGIDTSLGFTFAEWQTAVDYWTKETAKLFELI